MVFPIKQQAVYSFRKVALETITSCSDDSLFHHPDHLRLQSFEGWHSFELRTEVDYPLAILHVHVQDSIARSPLRSPYGSFHISKEVPVELLMEFIQYVEDQLKILRAETILLLNPPEAFNPEKSNGLQKALSNAGYRIEREETSSLIPITSNAFQKGLHQSELKRLRKSRKAGLVVQEVTLDHLEEVYHFLTICRQLKNYSLSMTWGEIKKLAETFPDRFLLMVVSDHDRMVAASLSLRITTQVIYDFYHDHDAAYDHYSPIVVLMEELYSICQRKGLLWLDLGTSQNGALINESLLTFKRRLGAIPSRKLTFVKNLKEL